MVKETNRAKGQSLLNQSPLDRIDGLVSISEESVKRQVGEEAVKRVKESFDRYRKAQAEGRERIVNKILF